MCFTNSSCYLSLQEKSKGTNGDANDEDDEVFVKSKSRRRKRRKKKLYTVQMFSDTRTNSIGVLDAFYFFYTAPVTVFAVNTVSVLNSLTFNPLPHNASF